MTIQHAWHRFVFEEYRAVPESLAIFRLLLVSYWLVVFAPRIWIAEFPDSFFNPPLGLTSLFFTGFPSKAFFVVLAVIQLVALVYLGAGRRTFAATLLLTGSTFLSRAWAYSFGKIDHDILFVIAPVFLLLAGWGEKGAVRAWPLALFAEVISLAMFTAAWQKVASGWLDPTGSAVFGHSLSNALSFEGRNSPVWRLAVRIVPDAGWEMLDYATVIVEASFILAIWRRRTFQLVCAVACLFHLGVMMLMQIVFLANILAYAAFVHWDGVAGRFGVRDQLARVQGWLRQRSDVQLLSTAAVLTILDIASSNPFRILISVDHVLIVLTWVAGLCAANFLASQLLTRLRRVRTTHVGSADSL